MYRASDLGRDANLPVLYMAYSPTILKHSPIEWHSHNITSAIRSSPLGSYSMNHVAFPNNPLRVSCLSVKRLVPPNVNQAMTLKQRGNRTHFLPFPSDPHIRTSISSSTYLVYSTASRWLESSSSEWTGVSGQLRW